MKKQSSAMVRFTLGQVWYLPFLLVIPASIFFGFARNMSTWTYAHTIREFYLTSVEISDLYAIYGAAAAYAANHLLIRQQQRTFLFSLPLDRPTVCKSSAIAAVFLLLEPLVHGILIALASKSPLLALSGGYVDFSGSFYGASLLLLALQVAGNPWGILSVLYGTAVMVPRIEYLLLGDLFLSKYLFPLYYYPSSLFSPIYHSPDVSQVFYVLGYATAVIGVCVLLLLLLPKLAALPQRIEGKGLSCFPRLEWLFRFSLGHLFASFLRVFFFLPVDLPGKILQTIFISLCAAILAQAAAQGTFRIWEHRKKIAMDTALLLLPTFLMVIRN